MKKQKTKKVVYYHDELNDDFAGNHIRAKTVDHRFPYVHKNPFWRLGSFLLYYGIAVPAVWLYMRIFLRVKYVNKKALKKLAPCFLYGNHSGVIDAFTPNLLSLPRRNRILADPDAVSIKGLKNIVQMFGALPVPSTMSGMRGFVKAVEYYHQKQNITIYPEAHIWPYYTGVRPFKDTSFAYPVKYNAPVIAMFTAYTEPKGLFAWFRKANITVYISEPMYPEKGLTGKAAQKDLRDKVYAFMTEKAQYSTHEVVAYKKIERETLEIAI